MFGGPGEGPGGGPGEGPEIELSGGLLGSEEVVEVLERVLRSSPSGGLEPP